MYYVYCFKSVGSYKHKLSRIESLVILYWGINCITLENVQRRATCLVNSLSGRTYEDRLKILGLSTLEYRRLKADVIQVYKILNQIDRVDIDKFFNMSELSTRGNSLKIFKPWSRLKVRSSVFSNRVVDVWNSLPNSVATAPSLNLFKSRLDKHWIGHELKFNASCYIPGDGAGMELATPGSAVRLTSVTCLATDASLTADPGVASSIPARSHTFVEIDHEIISTVILLPSAESFKKGCCQLQAKVCARSTG